MLFKILLPTIFVNVVYSLSEHPILIIVSYDGFKYNYLNSKTVPHMSRIRQMGTYSDYLINVFPTKTFPNHHSIATGLYPESHGVIGNTYVDPIKNSVVSIGYDMFHYNEDVVPIWRRNEDAGNGRYSGLMMWPGGVYAYQGKNATYRENFNPSYDWYKRVDTAISWIKDQKKPANLVLIYFEEPDTHSHIFGTESNEVQSLIKKLDNITLYLENQLELNGLTDKANVIHLSDHGMVNVSPPQFINITQYLTPNMYTMAGSSPILQIVPKKEYESQAYENLKNASKSNGHFKVYKKSEYLDRWHYKNNSRSPPMIVMADVGYALDDLILATETYAKHFNINVTPDSKFGVHGYDYTVDDMHPFFMARGPKIRQNNKVKPFHTVDLFLLFCEILEIPSTKNNGTYDNINGILSVTNGGGYTVSSILIITVGGVLIALILIGIAAAITLLMIKRQQNITTTAALNKRFPQTFQSNIEAQHLLEPEEA